MQLLYAIVRGGHLKAIMCVLGYSSSSRSCLCKTLRDHYPISHVGQWIDGHLCRRALSSRLAEKFRNMFSDGPFQRGQIKAVAQCKDERCIPLTQRGR